MRALILALALVGCTSRVEEPPSVGAPLVADEAPRCSGGFALGSFDDVVEHEIREAAYAWRDRSVHLGAAGPGVCWILPSSAPGVSYSDGVIAIGPGVPDHRELVDAIGKAIGMRYD